MATTYGLTNDSILNKSSYFHVTEGLAPDIMHDILEGSLQYVLKVLINHLISSQVATLQQLNSRIELFKYSSCDVKNKPALLSQNNLSSNDHTLKGEGALYN